jgi:hypothetical protein
MVTPTEREYLFAQLAATRERVLRLLRGLSPDGCFTRQIQVSQQTLFAGQDVDAGQKLL